MNRPGLFRPRFFSAHAVSLTALLAACAGQVSDVQDDGASVERGAHVTEAVRHDESGPLRLMPVPAPTDTFVEHEVKPIPRNFNKDVRADPVRQLRAPAMLAP